MFQEPKCKICRRLGVKLFLKGDRCTSPKCSMIKKPYPPGEKKLKQRRRGSFSEYSKELREKQKLKNWYNLEEKQFQNYVKEVLKKRGKIENPADLLIKVLESRLDNIIFRLGFAVSRAKAKQLVSHGHFLVNNKSVTLPSYQVKRGDKISISPLSLKKNVFRDLELLLKKQQPLPWLKLDKKKLEGEIITLPSIEDVVPPIEIPIIFEYYSK